MRWFSKVPQLSAMCATLLRSCGLHAAYSNHAPPATPLLPLLPAAGKCAIAFERVPAPLLEQPGDAIVRIELCGLCGSDLVRGSGVQIREGQEGN